jgi:DNA-binding Lrp family transcriptional regulator
VCIFDELETIGAHRIVGANSRSRRVVRKWTHANLPDLAASSFRHRRRKVHAKEDGVWYISARSVHGLGVLRMIQLDAFDLKMLAALQDDGRLTNQQLADLVGLSASQCSRRRMRLEEARVISGYHADLAGEALGFGLIAFIHITLATHSPDNAKKFRALVNRVDDIQEAYSLTGDADYLLKAVLRDLKSLSDIVNNVLMPHQSVAHVRSSIVLDRLKESAKLPLKALRA